MNPASTRDSEGENVSDKPKGKCTARTEVYTRVCGFMRPVQCFNKGKKEEYKERKPFKVTESMGSE